MSEFDTPALGIAAFALIADLMHTLERKAVLKRADNIEAIERVLINLEERQMETADPAHRAILEQARGLLSLLRLRVFPQQTG